MNQFVDREMNFLDSGFICSTVRIDENPLDGRDLGFWRTSWVINPFQSEILDIDYICFSSHSIDVFPKLKYRWLKTNAEFLRLDLALTFFDIVIGRHGRSSGEKSVMISRKIQLSKSNRDQKKLEVLISRLQGIDPRNLPRPVTTIHPKKRFPPSTVIQHASLTHRFHVRRTHRSWACQSIAQQKTEQSRVL